MAKSNVSLGPVTLSGFPEDRHYHVGFRDARSNPTHIYSISPPEILDRGRMCRVTLATLLILRGTILNRTYGTHKHPYISAFFTNSVLVLLTMVPRNITGDHSKYKDLRYTQAPIYFRHFLQTMFWSYLLWSPVILPGITVNIRTYGTHKHPYTSAFFTNKCLVLFTMARRNRVIR